MVNEIPIGIAELAKTGLELVDEPRLKYALLNAYEGSAGIEATEVANRVLCMLTARTWPIDVLASFIAGWRSTHVTALFVSGLLIRICRESEKLPSYLGSEHLLKAIKAVGEIIVDDTGVGGVPHNELFEEFATFVVGDDRWKLRTYEIPRCEQFREHVKEQRLEAPLEDAILTTAASEIWNFGEFTFLDNLIQPWLVNILGRPKEDVAGKLLYVSAHAGNSERNHFLYAIEAWESYCRAFRYQIRPEKAQAVFELYLRHVGQAYSSLEQVLRA